MSNSSDDFARYADAERQLCDEAGPLLAAIFHDIERRAGIFITELRVTLDRTGNGGDSISANCTIVAARPSLLAADAARSTEQRARPPSSNQS
jgi:hypothetical protein